MKRQRYNYSVDDRQQKYRNLLQTYKLNKEKQRKSGESKVTWELFNLFESRLGEKSSVMPPDELLSSTINNSLDDGDESLVSESDETSEKSKIKPANKKMNLSRYLYEKSIRQTKKEKKDEERWVEKKLLKEKEKQAINNLADAVETSGASVPDKRKSPFMICYSD